MNETEDAYNRGKHDGAVETLCRRLDRIEADYDKRFSKIAEDLELIKRICWSLVAITAITTAPGILQIFR